MSETNIKNGVGRPNKKGLDYFAHLVKHSDEENIIFQQFGCIGYTVYYSIREKITENGYYYELTDRKKLLLCSQFHIEIPDFNKIISFAIDLELFDKALFEKYGVLTSERLQIDYIFSASRRTQIDFITEYCLISNTVLYREFSDSKVLEKITYYSICDNNNSISDNSNSQSKVKYSKSNSEKVIKTTIDYDLQKKMQEVVKSYVDFTRSEGITNAAMLVVENKTRNVNNTFLLILTIGTDLP